MPMSEPIAHGTYIEFVPQDIPEDRKTRPYLVRAKRDGAQLGIIKWYPGWRKYAFFPAGDTIFEQRCMRDIAQFIESKTDQQKTDGKPPKLKVR